MIKHLKPRIYAKISIPFVACSILLAITAGGTAYARNGQDARTASDPRSGIGVSSGAGLQGSDRRGEASDPYSFNPCDLKDVECPSVEYGDGRFATSSSNGIDGSVGEGADSRIRKSTDSIGGYEIANYATLPTHEATVKAIYDAMPEIKDKFDADKYIKSKRPNSPVRGGMVERASIEYGVDMKLMLALMQNDSAFGTAGLGSRTRNPGNIANRDDGHTHTYPSWEDGVRGVARWLANHKN